MNQNQYRGIDMNNFPKASQYTVEEAIAKRMSGAFVLEWTDRKTGERKSDVALLYADPFEEPHIVVVEDGCCLDDFELDALHAGGVLTGPFDAAALLASVRPSRVAPEATNG